MARAFRNNPRSPLVLFCCLASIGFFANRAPAEKLYMIGAVADTFSRSDLDGSNHEVVLRAVDGIGDSASLAIDAAGGKMYWTDRVLVDSQLGRIMRANLDGTNVEEVLTVTGFSPFVTEIKVDPSGGKIYWSDITKISRANLDGSNVEDLIVGPAAWSFALDLANGKAYWVHFGIDEIQRSNLDGSGFEVIVDSSSGFESAHVIRLDLANGMMYWVTSTLSEHAVFRADLDGSNIQRIDALSQDVGINPSSIDLDIPNGKIYLSATNPNKIYRANLDGSGIEELLDSAGIITLDLSTIPAPPLPVRGEKLYLATFSDIQRCDLDGARLETIVDNSQIGGFALDPSTRKLYWSDWNIGTLSRMDMDGTDAELILDSANGLVQPTAMALDAVSGKMYWADQSLARISRANTDGSAIETIIPASSGLLAAGSIALDQPMGKLYWSDFLAEKIQRSNLEGSTIETLIDPGDGLGRPVRVALDLVNAKMYWTAEFPDAIYRANRDGSGVEALPSTLLINMSAIAVAPVRRHYFVWVGGASESVWRFNIDDPFSATILRDSPGFDPDIDTTFHFELDLTPSQMPGPRVSTVHRRGGGFVEEGDSVTLEVQVAGLTEPVSGPWVKDGIYVTPDGNVQTDLTLGDDSVTAVLTIQSVDPSHAGTYWVAGRDGAKSLFESETLTLTVVPPGSLPATSGPGLILIMISIVAGGAFMLAGRRLTTR